MIEKVRHGILWMIWALPWPAHNLVLLLTGKRLVKWPTGHLSWCSVWPVDSLGVGKTKTHEANPPERWFSARPLEKKIGPRDHVGILSFEFPAYPTDLGFATNTLSVVKRSCPRDLGMFYCKNCLEEWEESLSDDFAPYVEITGCGKVIDGRCCGYTHLGYEWCDDCVQLNRLKCDHIGEYEVIATTKDLL